MSSPPTPPPPEQAPPSGRNRFGWGAIAVVAASALGAGLAFGAFVPGLWRDAPNPSPSVSTAPSSDPSPTEFVEVTRLTIPEGYRASAIFARASETLGIPVEDFEAAAADPESLGLPLEADGDIEGWLGAFTYQIPETATAADVLSEMIDATVMHLELKGIAREDWQEVLTKASLIEREVRRDEDRPKVARVIENRLAQDMLLQFDSTVHYYSDVDGVFTGELDRQSDNPYNTYKFKGLPPGPICSPGLPAIDAVLAPADGPRLYFVTVNLDTGETRFAEGFDEHQQNVELLRQWMAANG